MSKIEYATWDDLANAYDKDNPGGRPARTLKMETIADWAIRSGKFVVINGYYVKKEEN